MNIAWLSVLEKLDMDAMSVSMESYSNEMYEMMFTKGVRDLDTNTDASDSAIKRLRDEIQINAELLKDTKLNHNLRKLGELHQKLLTNVVAKYDRIS